MGRKYSTMMGKALDMDALRTKNEKVRAVGNMNVNARGDTIDSHNRVINDNNKRINSMYAKLMKDKANMPPVKQEVEKPKSKIIKNDLSTEELGFDDYDEPNPKK